VRGSADAQARVLQAEAKMGKDLSTGNLKSHLQHNHRAEFQVGAVCVRASPVLRPRVAPALRRCMQRGRHSHLVAAALSHAGLPASGIWLRRSSW